MELKAAQTCSAQKKSEKKVKNIRGRVHSYRGRVPRTEGVPSGLCTQIQLVTERVVNLHECLHCELGFFVLTL
jgi:hypothetical protein